MSLVVWLPLTKDLRQQGLATITSTGTPVFKNSGKLGNQSLDLNTRITFNCPAMANKSTFSVAFWAKVNTDTSLTTNWVDVIGFTDQTSGGTNGQLRWETCYASGSETRGISSHDNTTNATSNSFGSIIGTTKGIWYHIACTVDIDNNVINEYRNGEVVHTITPNGGHLTGAFWIGETGKINGEIQDVRIYDHCLSPMEVKELAKGLVLHYPLNRQGWGQENILLNSASEKTGASNSAQWFRWNTNATLTANQTYTLSFDAKMTIATDVFYISWSNNDSTQEVWNQGTQVTTEYKRYSFTGSTTKTNINAILMSNYKGYNRGNNNNTTGVLSVKNVKLEVGDKVTPWCPNSADTLATTMGLNSTTEYDCSGFCNNGTKNNITYTSDTPKYAVGSIFNGSNSYIKVDDNNWMIKGMSEMTVNIWAKATTWPTNGGRLLSCTETGGFNLEAGNSGYWRFPIYVYTNSGQTSSAYKYDSNEIKIADLIPNDWNMITLVYDNTGTKTYLNGELHHTYTNTSYGINFNTNARLFLGCEASTASPSSPYFNGIESDFRIYATALSADDVKSLYQNCATIVPDGTIRGQIRS